MGVADVNPLTTSAFDLPDHLTAKADPALIAEDERHFAAIAESLEQTIADLSRRLDAARRAPGRRGQEAMERDLEVHRLSARLRSLRRFGLDLCLGRIVARRRPRAGIRRPARPDDGAGAGCWSTGARPRPSRSSARPTPTRWGWRSRRRYRWTRGRISDYWDEVFTADGLEGHAALDDQSAFIASLGGSRSARMRDVLGTIQADQDADHPRRIPRRAGRRRRPRHRQDRRRAAPHGVPAVLRPAAAVRTAAACCSSVRTSPTWPTSPTCCPASARRACRPARCVTSSPRALRRRSRADPDVARLKSSAGHGAGDRGRGAVLRAATHQGDDGRDRLVRHSAEPSRLGRGVRRARTRHPAQRSAGADLGAAAHHPDGQAADDDARRRAPKVAAEERRIAYDARRRRGR